MRPRLLDLVALASLASFGCAGYSSALGFRARQAVLHRDIEQFNGLMEEAADATPKGPLDNPKKTVLTHFLDLAGDPRFFSYIDDWKKRGWVAEDMTCSIYRAHHRATRRSDPAAAERSVEVCLANARAGASDPEKSWLVGDCLDGAAFLTETSTAALVPILQLVANPSEPLKFRAGLLSGMTDIPISGTRRHMDNDTGLTKEQASERVEDQLDGLRARLDWILDAARPYMDATLLAGSTAIGVMRIEYASSSIGRSYVGRFAQSDSPDDNDLAWAWTRAAKNKKPPKDIEGLGLWNKDRELKEDVYWYLCSRPGGAPAAQGSAAAALGPIEVLDAISIRTKAKVLDLVELRTKHCADKTGAEPYPQIKGPFPAESIARGSVAEAHTSPAAPATKKQSTAIVLKRRLIL